MKNFLLMLVVFTLSIVIVNTASAATVGLRQAGTDLNEIWVLPGDSFTVELFIDFDPEELALPIFSGANGIVGATIDIEFDSFVDYTPLTFVKGTGWTFGDVTDVGGKLDIIMYNFGIPIAADNIIATLDFVCLAPVDSIISAMEHYAPSLSSNFGFSDSITNLEEALANGLNKDIADAIIYDSLTVHQSPIPIPSSLLLLGGGIFALLGITRRKKG
jgi:hypothetical protein